MSAAAGQQEGVVVVATVRGRDEEAIRCFRSHCSAVAQVDLADFVVVVAAAAGVFQTVVYGWRRT